METFNISEKWSNGERRTLTRAHQFDPFDDKVEVAAGDSRKLVIDGNGNATISRQRARIYAHYKNYDSILTLTLIPNFKGDLREANCALKLRSRHEEYEEECPKDDPVFDSNAFGGYGFSVSKEKWKSQREPTHNCHDQSEEKRYPDNKKLENGKEYKLRFTVKDEGDKVRQIGEVDFNDDNGFVTVMNLLDNSPKSWMTDRPKYMDGNDSSYLWIRNNANTDQSSITVRDVKLDVLP